MTFDPDDPRLTAYALGELEGDERATVEALLAESPDARHFVAETRALADLLAEQLGAEPSPGLAPEQKAAIETELSRPTTGEPAGAVVPFRPLSSRVVRYSLAATVLIALGAGTLALWNHNRPNALKLTRALQRARVAREPEATVALAPAPAGAETASANLAKNRLGDAVAAPESKPRPLGEIPRDGGIVFRSPKSSSGPAVASDAGRMSAPSASSPASDFAAGGTRGGMGMGGMSGRPGMPGMGASRGTPAAPSSPLAIGQRAGAAQSRQKALAVEALAAKDVRDSLDNDNVSLPPTPADRSAPAQTANRFLKPERELTPSTPSEKPVAGKPAVALGVTERENLERQELFAKRAEDPLRLKLVEDPQRRRNSGSQQGQQGQGQQGQGQQVQDAQGQSRSGEAQVNRSLALNDRVDSNSLIQNGTSTAALAPAPAANPEPAVPSLEQARPIGQERFTPIVENPFEPVTPDNTLSTFSIDVDTASYANVRRYLTQNLWPPADAVRIEEMVNYFDYEYAPPSPTDDVPFAVHSEVVRCPWNPDNRLLRVALKGQVIDFARRKPSNLVFLVDVSGSMNQPNKLPLVKAGLRMLVEQLGENDKIALVVYAGNSGLALPATRGDQKETLLSAIDRLTPGGSTHGSAGLVLAYQIAVENFVQGGINRVILATDGDFNVGVTGPDAVAALAAEKAKTGVFLNVLGVGDGNLKDETMEKIADKGNGTYNYLDTLLEARKVLVEQVGGTLVTIAKDVKIQVEFNPAKVTAFRLIGYENRLLADADFADDTKDAGEIGSGHTVTALYELVPATKPEQLAEAKLGGPAPAVGGRYVKPAEVKADARISNELLTVHLRYKAPEGHKSTPIDHPVADDVKDLGRASADTKFAAAVAEFGMLLRGSRFVGQGNLDAVLELARANLGPDPSGRRHEFVELVEKAKALRAQ